MVLPIIVPSGSGGRVTEINRSGTDTLVPLRVHNESKEGLFSLMEYTAELLVANIKYSGTGL